MRKNIYTDVLKKIAAVSAFQDPARMTDGIQPIKNRADAGMPVLTLAQALRSSVYGYPYLGHVGIDFAVPVGTPIYAPTDGSIWIGPSDGTQGIYLNHRLPDGADMTLAHLSKIVLASGAKTKKGDLLGYSGDTGYTTVNGKKQKIAAHLHVHVAKDKKIVDAYPYIFGGELEKTQKDEETEMNLPKLLAANANAPKAFMIACPAHRVKKDAEEELSALRALYPDADIRKDGKWYEIVLGRHEGTIEQARKDVELLRQVTGRQIVLWSW